jgi:hypothetical protein
MLMPEYALMRDGLVHKVVTTTGTESDVRRSHPDYQVKDVRDIPTNVLERYEYWSERP